MTEPRIERGTRPLTRSAEAALKWFDSLAPCPLENLSGRWLGREVLTDHPLDGALGNLSWYGKQFDGPDRVHPLLVSDTRGRPFPLEPTRVPMFLIRHPLPTPRLFKRAAPATMTGLRRLVQARRYGASLSMMCHRGVTTAAMTYEKKPITDYFRTLDQDSVLGLMEYAGMPRPYFFVLHRDLPR